MILGVIIVWYTVKVGETMSQKINGRYSPVIDGFQFELWASHVQSKRLRAGLTMQQVADQIGRSKVSISRWERRITVPSIADFLVMCAFFDLAPSEYMKLEKTMEKTMHMWDSTVIS